MRYYVFQQRDKGGCFITPMTKDELEKRLADQEDLGGRPILDKMPDWDYEERGIVIIKGEIVKPEPVRVVTEYKMS